AATGSEPLLQAIEVVRALDAGARPSLTPDDPCSFVPADWRPYLVEDGRVDRRIWEVALALGVRDALRAGGLFRTDTGEHVSFWNLIYDNRNWQGHRSEAYRRLGLPADPNGFLRQLVAEFDRAARSAAAGLSRNRFARVQDGRLKLRRRDALPV